MSGNNIEREFEGKTHTVWGLLFGLGGVRSIAVPNAAQGGD
jgi:hypothetical protein